MNAALEFDPRRMAHLLIHPAPDSAFDFGGMPQGTRPACLLSHFRRPKVSESENQFFPQFPISLERTAPRLLHFIIKNEHRYLSREIAAGFPGGRFDVSQAHLP